jgi:scyllo-inositol 2-dehydrogenase (NAD+)
MTEAIRCAVFGLGRLGRLHAENLAVRIKGARLAWVVDPMPGVAEKTAADLGTRGSMNPEEVFLDDKVDAVIIATPTNTHGALIRKAAEAGKHIFVEKPLALSLEETEEAIRVIARHQVTCQVGFMRRFDPAYAEAKRQIAAGAIGKPVYFKGISRDPGSPPAQFIGQSGGLFLDMCIHDYDIARFLMGAEVTSVLAGGSILCHEFMAQYRDVDQAVTYMTFDSGAAGDVEGSRNAFYGYDVRAEVLGTEGAITIGSLRHRDIRIMSFGGIKRDIVPAFPERFRDAYELELQHFVRCLLTGEAPAVGAQDGKKALEIALAAKQSFEKGEKVELVRV